VSLVFSPDGLGFYILYLYHIFKKMVLLLLPEAKRLTTGIRFWLEDLIEAGGRICCFAVANPQGDIFIKMIEVELEMPSDRAIRCAMEDEAAKLNLNLTASSSTFPTATLSWQKSHAGEESSAAREIGNQSNC
jgi:hypothetical protein